MSIDDDDDSIGKTVSLRFNLLNMANTLGLLDRVGLENSVNSGAGVQLTPQEARAWDH